LNNGYYALTTSNATILTQTSTVDSSTIQILAKSNGTQGSYNDAGSVITFNTWKQSGGFEMLRQEQRRQDPMVPTSKLANILGTVVLGGSVKPYSFACRPLGSRWTLGGSGMTSQLLH